jgi:hypothetical protein
MTSRKQKRNRKRSRNSMRRRNQITKITTSIARAKETKMEVARIQKRAKFNSNLEAKCNKSLNSELCVMAL